jgi:hypothetical protein
VGLVFAVAGFCFAVSTGVPTEQPADVSARAVGTSFPLRFTNPLVPATVEYDLGDAALGSTDARVITRYVTAEGGLRPYRFTSTGPNSLTNAVQGTLSSLVLGVSGALVGTMPYSLAVGNPLHTTVLGTPGLHFQVTVEDSRGTSSTSQTAWFNLFLYDRNAVPFRFAMDRLPDARLCSSYVSRVDVIGGTAPYTYSLVSVTGPGISSNDDLGVFVTSDGAVIGNPLAEGTFTLVIRCTDAAGAVAAGRNGSGSSQAFLLNVLPNPIVSSDLLTLSCVVKGDAGNLGRDTLKFTGIVNAQGQDLAELMNSSFSFQLGNISASGKLGRSGSLKQRQTDGSELSVKINPNSGTLDVKIKKGVFATALNAAALIDGQLTRRPLQVTIGDALVSSEVLDFETSVRGSRYALNYKLGRNGSSAAGGFLVTNVKGKDGVGSGGLPGDAWRVGFLAAARKGLRTATNPGLNDISGVTIRVGANFVQALTGPGFKSRGDRTSFSGGRAGNVSKFTFNARMSKGTLNTNVLTFKSTGIPQAINAVKYGNVYFPLGVDITRSAGASFTGEHSRRVFGFGKQYKDSPPRR